MDSKMFSCIISSTILLTRAVGRSTPSGDGTSSGWAAADEGAAPDEKERTGRQATRLHQREESGTNAAGALTHTAHIDEHQSHPRRPAVALQLAGCAAADLLPFVSPCGDGMCGRSVLQTAPLCGVDGATKQRHDGLGKWVQQQRNTALSAERSSLSRTATLETRPQLEVKESEAAHATVLLRLLCECASTALALALALPPSPLRVLLHLLHSPRPLAVRSRSACCSVGQPLPPSSDSFASHRSINIVRSLLQPC